MSDPIVAPGSRFELLQPSAVVVGQRSPEISFGDSQRPVV
jgi:hypothetical protein